MDVTMNVISKTIINSHDIKSRLDSQDKKKKKDQNILIGRHGK